MTAYAGRLWVNREWLEVAISVDDAEVRFEAYGRDLGSYSRDDVDIRFDGESQFSLRVDDETLVFLPDARSAFAAAIVQIPGRAARGGRHAASRRVLRQRQAWS